MSKSGCIILTMYAFIGIIAGLIAFGLGAPWWLAILSAIAAPPVFGYLAGMLVMHSIISLIEDKEVK